MNLTWDDIGGIVDCSGPGWLVIELWSISAWFSLLSRCLFCPSDDVCLACYSELVHHETASRSFYIIHLKTLFLGLYFLCETVSSTLLNRTITSSLTFVHFLTFLSNSSNKSCYSRAFSHQCPLYMVGCAVYIRCWSRTSSSLFHRRGFSGSLYLERLANNHHKCKSAQLCAIFVTNKCQELAVQENSLAYVNESWPYLFILIDHSFSQNLRNKVRMDVIFSTFLKSKLAVYVSKTSTSPLWQKLI